MTLLDAFRASKSCVSGFRPERTDARINSFARKDLLRPIAKMYATGRTDARRHRVTGTDYFETELDNKTPLADALPVRLAHDLSLKLSQVRHAMAATVVLEPPIEFTEITIG